MTLVTVLVERDCAHCEGAIDHVDQLAQDHGLPVAALALDQHRNVLQDLDVDQHPAVRVGQGPVYAGIPDQETFAKLARAGGAR